REIEWAAARLRSAQRSAIVAGAGALASGAGKELLALGEALAAPIATSLGGRGLIPTRHPLSAGCAGNYAAPPANQIVHEAELVVFVGCHTGDQVTHTWRIPPLDTPCIQIDIAPPASLPPGGRRARRPLPAMPRRSGRIGSATKSPAPCRRTESLSPTRAIRGSGAAH